MTTTKFTSQTPHCQRDHRPRVNMYPVNVQQVVQAIKRLELRLHAKYIRSLKMFNQLMRKDTTNGKPCS